MKNLNIDFFSQYVFGEKIMQGNLDLSKTLAISVITKPDNRFDLGDKFAASAQLIFEDDHFSFTTKHAKVIYDLVFDVNGDLKPYDNIYVHCLMGISRSAAIVLFIKDVIELLKLPVKLNHIPSYRFETYNSRVFTLLFDHFQDHNPKCPHL
jgi:predicted protein tyrosine phosphatase